MLAIKLSESMIKITKTNPKTNIKFEGVAKPIADDKKQRGCGNNADKSITSTNASHRREYLS